METFINNALSSKPNASQILFNPLKPLNDGKSGAHVFEVEGRDLILKLYPPRKGVVNDEHYIRSIRDIVMTKITPDTISPRVEQFGITECCRPFLVMEKIKGIELYDYVPNGSIRDVRILYNIVEALKTFYENCEKVYNKTHKGTLQTCHRDLHPHNVFIVGDEVRLIDFDLAICPYDILRDSETTKRQNALHRPWLQLIMGNYSRPTEEYVNWSNLMESVPKYIQEDSDLFQLYSVFRYFEHHNKKLVMLTSQLRRETSKDMFLKKSSMILKSLKKYNIQF
jgi:serine/threonine protein kinase